VVSSWNPFPAQCLAEFSSHSRSEAENSLSRDFTNEFLQVSWICSGVDTDNLGSLGSFGIDLCSYHRRGSIFQISCHLKYSLNPSHSSSIFSIFFQRFLCRPWYLLCRISCWQFSSRTRSHDNILPPNRRNRSPCNSLQHLRLWTKSMSTRPLRTIRVDWRGPFWCEGRMSMCACRGYFRWTFCVYTPPWISHPGWTVADFTRFLWVASLILVIVAWRRTK